MVRICPVSIPWFRSKKQWKMGKVCSWVCSCEFSKKRVSSCLFSKSGQIQPCLLRRVSSYVDMLSVRFPSVGGVKKIGRLKMFLVRFPTAAQPQKQKTPPPLVPPRTFIRGSFFENRPSKTVSLQNKQTNKQNQTLYSIYYIYFCILYIVYYILYVVCCLLFVVCCI